MGLILGPRVPLCGLWRRTSARGNVYFTGRIGSALKLVIFEKRNRKAPEEPEWEAFLVGTRTEGKEKTPGDGEKSESP